MLVARMGFVVEHREATPLPQIVKQKHQGVELKLYLYCFGCFV